MCCYMLLEAVCERNKMPLVNPSERELTNSPFAQAVLKQAQRGNNNDHDPPSREFPLATRFVDA